MPGPILGTQVKGKGVVPAPAALTLQSGKDAQETGTFHRGRESKTGRCGGGLGLCTLHEVVGKDCPGGNIVAEP